jgi:hypothetical protein
MIPATLNSRVSSASGCGRLPAGASESHLACLACSLPAGAFSPGDDADQPPVLVVEDLPGSATSAAG